MSSNSGTQSCSSIGNNDGSVSGNRVDRTPRTRSTATQLEANFSSDTDISTSVAVDSALRVRSVESDSIPGGSGKDCDGARGTAQKCDVDGVTVRSCEVCSGGGRGSSVTTANANDTSSSRCRACTASTCRGADKQTEVLGAGCVTSNAESSARFVPGKLNSDENRMPLVELVSWLFVALVVFTSVALTARWKTPNQRVDLEWLQTAVIYQIYPRSFQDSNDDGVGDIPGIISRLEYLVSLGVGALWLSPVYRSPMVDFGYDVSDHCDIDPLFGTTQDLMTLIGAAHDSGLKVILDFIPNHTSNQHPWFKASRTRDDEYVDYYIWNDGLRSETGSPLPPNNWLNAFGGSAWEWDDRRHQFYLHQFTSQQPDLNYRNVKVFKRIKEVLQFWLDRGVDGFRVDAVDFLFESSDVTLNEPINDALENTVRQNVTNTATLRHVHTRHQPEVHEVIADWRRLFDEHQRKTGKRTFLLLETFDDSVDMQWWRTCYDSGADMPCNFYVMERMRTKRGGRWLHEIVAGVLRNLPENKLLNWVLSSHDQKRVATRYGHEYVGAFNMIVLLLPGTAITYQGEELSMEDIQLDYKHTRDTAGIQAGPISYVTVSRDGSRSPMQWNAEKNAGFSNASATWLPVHENYRLVNMQVQSGDPTSTLEQFRWLVSLRAQPAFHWGDVQLTAASDHVFSFVRYTLGKMYARYLVAVNVGTMPSREDLTRATDDNTVSDDPIVVPKTGKVVFVTPSTAQSQNVSMTSSTDRYVINGNINLRDVILEPGQGIIVMFFATGL